jgi:alcohol dehydrogenase (cytochrome c)
MNTERGAFAILAAACIASNVAAANLPPPFTQDQAREGEAVYDGNCSRCHGSNLSGGQFGTALTGDRFTANWQGKNLADYFTKVVTTMPVGQPGSLDRASYAKAVAYILQSNGLQSGSVRLPSEASAMTPFTIPASRLSAGSEKSPEGSGVSSQAVASPAPAPNEEEGRIREALTRKVETVSPQAKALLNALSPVTDAMLRSPSIDDWLIWRRTYDNQGYSPLKQINAHNVKSLREVWAWSLASGWMEATPLVHDGVLFIQSGLDTIQALDGATGDLLWNFVRRAPAGAEKSNAGLSTVKRNMAISGTTLFAATVDAHVVALDMKSGRLLWDQPIADYKESWYVSSGPLVVKGKVITGVAGTTAKQPGGASIVALDAETGKESWRFKTVARPGEPGGDTWNGLPLERRSGGSIWTAGGYDPDLDLVFFGTGNTYDIEPYRTKSTPDANMDLLYTNTTLALNPESGKLVWFYQHMPNDLLDLDWAFEQTIATIKRAEGPQKIVITGGKIALFDAVDARTGKYVLSRDFGLQNVVTAIDKQTGAKTINPETVPVKGKAQMICPSALGARTWEATSLDPTTMILYAPLEETCTTDVNNLISALIPRPGNDGKLGRLAAMDIQTGKILWTERAAAIQTAALLATAGGIVFNANIDRWFRANDAKTGAELWKTRLHDTPNAFPISYMVKGKQYVAIAAGGAKTSMGLKMNLMPEVHLPAGAGSVLWVFALPNEK